MRPTEGERDATGTLPVDRSGPPPPGPERPFRFPAFTRHRLANGLSVLLAPRPGTPLVTLELLVPGGGTACDPAQAPGLAGMVAALVDEGTATRSALEIAAQVERLGGQLATGARWDSAYLLMQAQERHLGPGLGLLAELAASPAFQAKELERLRRLRLTELLRRRDLPAALADERFAWAIYGDSTYGRPPLGTEASLGALDRDQVVGFFRRGYAPSGAILVAAGDFDPQRFLEAADAVLGGIPPGDPPALPEVTAPQSPGLRVHVVDRPGAPQCALRLGHASLPRRHPDFTRLKVMSSLLGGKFTSRLTLNLRERHGYTYGVYSVLAGRLGPGPFYVTTDVAVPVAGAAVRETLRELRRLREEPVDEAELADTRSYLVGAFPSTVQTTYDLVLRLENLGLYGLPDDHYRRYLAEVAEVSREDVLRVAREHLRPDEMAVVAVGPAAELVPQLEDLGPLEVVSADWRSGRPRR